MSRTLPRHARIRAFPCAALLALGLLAAPPAVGLTTDRPDAAESAWTVGAFRFQMETGVEVATDEVGGADILALTTPTKLRFGVLPFLELHVQSDALVYRRVTPPGGSTDAETLGADLDFGFKFHAMDGDGFVPAVGLVASVTAPTGSAQVSADAWLLTPILALEWGLPLGFGVAANAGFTVPLSDREQVGDVALYALTLGRSLSPIADWLGLFVQCYGETPIDEGDTLLHVGGGATFLVHEQVQLDAYVNGGVTDAAPDIVAGAGLSFRL